jgi:hypothetical protein
MLLGIITSLAESNEELLSILSRIKMTTPYKIMTTPYKIKLSDIVKNKEAIDGTNSGE